MKLSTLWEAYRRTVARKRLLEGYPAVNLEHRAILRSAVSRRIRQCDKLEKAITRRIAAMEATNG